MVSRVLNRRIATILHDSGDLPCILANANYVN